MSFLKPGNQYYKVEVSAKGKGMAAGTPQRSYFVVEAPDAESAKKVAEAQMEKTWSIEPGSAKAGSVILNRSFQNGRTKALADIERLQNSTPVKSYLPGDTVTVKDGFKRGEAKIIAKVADDTYRIELDGKQYNAHISRFQNNRTKENS